MKKRIIAVLISLCITGFSTLCPVMVQAEGIGTGPFVHIDAKSVSGNYVGLDAKCHTQGQILEYNKKHPVKDMEAEYVTEPTVKATYATGELTEADNQDSLNVMRLCNYMAGEPKALALNKAQIYAKDTDNKEPASEENDTKQKKEKSVSKAVFCSGAKGGLWIENAKGTVKWSVGNKDILQIVKKTNKKCIVKALKDGKTYVKASAKNIDATYKVTVKSGKAFVKAWCKLWVETNIPDGMGDKGKVVTASLYLSSSGLFSIGDTYEPEDLLVKGYGNCVSGGKLLVSMCEAMGYQAKLRFAAKDNMSRYPEGVIFASQHYNVEVILNGKKYYTDGMPGCWFTYLSTSKKPIYYSSLGMPIPE